MNFKEFIAREEMDLIAEEMALDPHFLDDLEQYDEIIGSALKFAAGAGGNFVSQLGRGAGNLVAGAAQGTYGAGQTAAGALQMASGGRKTGWERTKKGLSNLWGGGKRVVRGAAQAGAAATGVSPALRGAQAMAEPAGLSGVYAPAGQGRNAAQDLLGLNAWKGQKSSGATPPPLPGQLPNIQTGQKPPQQVQQTPNIQTGAQQSGGKIKMQCPNGHNLSVPSSEHGRKGACPKCGARFKIPTIGDPAARRKELEQKRTSRGLAQMGRQEQFRDLVNKYRTTRDPKIQQELMTKFPREFQSALIKSQGARGARQAQAARERAGSNTRTIATA